jgi:Patatin-like phospholipase
VTEKPNFDCARDWHLFGPGPKRILALDGGGVRGAITVAFLERIEDILSKRLRIEVRLGDWFDLVGGTSTGALIAGALALGFRTEQIKDFYLRLAPRAFQPTRWGIPLFQAKFNADGLRAEILKIVQDRKLSSADLVTGLCVVTKRMDTCSPWIVANNPRAPYWLDGEKHDGNDKYSLATLVRASTAAPHFFDPEVFPISKNEDGLFIDGGVTPFNNPSLALFQMTTFKPFGICWPTGPDQLTVTSIGTGTYRPHFSYEEEGVSRFAKLAYYALMSLMTDAETMTLAQMQWMGECLTRWKINSEVGTLCDEVPQGGKMFRFMRYDVKLESDWLREELDVKVSDRDAERFRGMDNPAIVNEIYEIAKLAAAKQVKAEHWLGALPEFLTAPGG